MRTYVDLPGLHGILLEESYVLDIQARPGLVQFAMDLVLTPDHDAYRAPHSGEQYCFRRGTLRFSDVTQLSWAGQGAPPARDASGEVDFGNIDAMEWDESSYSLEGDWGRMEVLAGRAEVELS
jgi:hypothetical protein